MVCRLGKDMPVQTRRWRCFNFTHGVADCDYNTHQCSQQVEHILYSLHATGCLAGWMAGCCSWIYPHSEWCNTKKPGQALQRQRQRQRQDREEEEECSKQRGGDEVNCLFVGKQWGLLDFLPWQQRSRWKKMRKRKYCVQVIIVF